VVTWWGSILISIASILASSGFWAHLQSRDNNKSATVRLLMGLAYYKITTLGLGYIDRGYITRDELEEYQKYFFEPYLALGGNGVAQRIHDEVVRLPFQPHSKYETLFSDREDERFIQDVPVRISKHAAPERQSV
jgi:hypothetical protein